MMPSLSQNLLNSIEVYSPPPFVLHNLIFSQHFLSTIALDFLNTSNTSLLCLMRYVHAFLVKSSMNREKYLLPLGVSICRGPYMSEYTISNLFFVFYGDYFLKLPLVCLHWTHSLHTVSGICISGSPLTIESLLSRDKYLKFN